MGTWYMISASKPATSLKYALALREKHTHASSDDVIVRACLQRDNFNPNSLAVCVQSLCAQHIYSAQTVFGDTRLFVVERFQRVACLCEGFQHSQNQCMYPSRLLRRTLPPNLRNGAPPTLVDRSLVVFDQLKLMYFEW